jgi:hypothetical protein
LTAFPRTVKGHREESFAQGIAFQNDGGNFKG